MLSFDNLKYPKLDSHGFLERAFLWLESGISIGIFYASLDLRFTLEKILIKHGFASTNYSKSFRQLKWQPKNLYQSLQDEFSGRLDISKSYRFLLGTGNDMTTMGYYLSIPPNLFSSYGKLDDYLHAQWAIPLGTPDKAWYKKQSAFLLGFANELIPHANPANSLDYFSIPNIKPEETDGFELENILREYWNG